MPWWAHKLALEGLSWEQPWLLRVEQVEVPNRPTFEFEGEDDQAEDAGAFVGVRQGPPR